MSDINLLTPIVTLAVGIALGYGFRGLIAREERAELIKVQGYYDEVLMAKAFDAKKSQVKEAL